MTEIEAQPVASDSPRPDYRGASYLLSAPSLAECPKDSLREVAFVGRSNAGKSSAINALTGQPGLARTSKTPGRTQLLNFFSVGEGLFLVDLPGFGYAKVPLPLKRKWQQQLERYLRQRSCLRGLVLLMDIRHPFTDFDRQMISWTTQVNLPLHLLLTKADKLGRGAGKGALLAARKVLAVEAPQATVQLFSSLKSEGIPELRKQLDLWLWEGAARPAQASAEEPDTAAVQSANAPGAPADVGGLSGPGEEPAADTGKGREDG